VATATSFLIGELAARLGLNPKTIRYYEEVGLLPEPERSDGGYRRYRRGDEERLRFVRGVRRLGFALGEIREVLALRDRGERPCSYVAELIEQRASEVDGQIAELERLKRELAELRDRARRLRPDDCGPEGYCHILEEREP
jgi:DNA-binding transcriptional MerR regulator